MGATAWTVADYFYTGLSATEVAEGAAAAGTAATAANSATTTTYGIGTGGTAGGQTLLGSVGTVAAEAAAVGLVGKALTPNVDRPDLPKPTPMPDAMEQAEARKRSLIEQFSRSGRASTVLTSPVSGSGKLGG
jgi:hypothetical protein